MGRRRSFSLALSIGLTVLMLHLHQRTAIADVAPSAPESTTGADKSPDRFITIHNDFYWVDQNGARILTRSGCLCQFNGVFYWYGGNPRGFREQNCYYSTDLVHWTNRGVILRHEPDANRIDVLYNEP